MTAFRTFSLIASLALAGVSIAGCGKKAATVGQQYSPETRPLVVTAVPLLVHEQTGTFDYLKKAFAKGGILNGKEVWGFAPSSITVYRGDTLKLTFVNPGDDPHTFTIDALAINAAIAGGTTSETSFVANRVGVYRFYCAIPEHAPYMSGTVTVLPEASAG